MTIVLEKQLPLTRADEQPVVGVTNPPLKKPRTDDQVESRPERQVMVDLILSLTATDIARFVAAIRRYKQDGPRQSKKGVRIQPDPTVKTEAEEKKQPLAVTPGSLMRITESQDFPTREAVPLIERNPAKHLETWFGRCTSPTCNVARTPNVLLLHGSPYSRMYRFAVSVPHQSPTIVDMSSWAV